MKQPIKKCICGCGEKLVKRDGETPFQFRARRVVNKKHFAVYRKARGWFTGDISKMRRKNLGKSMKKVFNILKQFICTVITMAIVSLFIIGMAKLIHYFIN